MERRILNTVSRTNTNSSHKGQAIHQRQSVQRPNRPNFVLRSFHQKRAANPAEDGSQEKLKLQLLQMKSTYKGMYQENVRLKTKVLGLQRQVSQLRQIALNGNLNVHEQRQVPESIIIGNLGKRIANLKRLIKQEQERNKLLSDQLETVKKSAKYTKIKQLEAEVQGYKEETVRLKSLLNVEEKQEHLEKMGKTQIFRKAIKHLETEKRELVHESEDYKYRLKRAMALVQKALQEGKQQVRIEKFRRLKGILGITSSQQKYEGCKDRDTNKENSPKREASQSQAKRVIGLTSEDKIRLFYKPVVRRQFVEWECKASTSSKQNCLKANDQYLNNAVRMLQKNTEQMSKKPLKVVQERFSEDVRTDWISSQPRDSPHHQNKDQESQAAINPNEDTIDDDDSNYDQEFDDGYSTPSIQTNMAPTPSLKLQQSEQRI